MGGESYLLGDLHEQCWTERHILYIMFVGLPSLVAYVIGIPGTAVYGVHTHTHTHIHTHTHSDIHLVHWYVFLHRECVCVGVCVCTRVCVCVCVCVICGFVAFGLQLMRKNKDKLHTDRLKLKYSFLYKGYELEWYFW